MTALPPPLLTCTALRRLNLTSNRRVNTEAKLELSLRTARALLRSNLGLRWVQWMNCRAGLHASQDGLERPRLPPGSWRKRLQ